MRPTIQVLLALNKIRVHDSFSAESDGRAMMKTYRLWVTASVELLSRK